MAKKEFGLDTSRYEVQELTLEFERINQRVVGEYHSEGFEDREVRGRWAMYLGEAYERFIRAYSEPEKSPGSAELEFRAMLREDQEGKSISWSGEDMSPRRLAELQDLFDTTVRRRAAENGR